MRFYRITSWIVAAALCLAFIPACLAAEEQAPSGDPFAVLDGLLEALEQNPSEGRMLEDGQTVNEYCLKLFGYIDPDKAQGVFYGGPDEAAGLLKPLSCVLYEIDFYADVSLENAEVFYVCVWALLHGDSTSQYKSRPYLKETMKEMFTDFSDDAIRGSVDVCVDYIEQYEPELTDESYTLYTYAADIGGNPEYARYYRQGVSLYDEGQYAEAIAAYAKCLDIVPNDPTASFEIAEVYITLREFEEAKSWLANIGPHLVSDSDKARWLRRHGYIAIEEGDFDAACAYYVYSKEFEPHTLADQELEYIYMVAPGTKTFTAREAAAYLKERGVTMDK